MGFFAKLFGRLMNCPLCGTAGARDSFSGIRCPSPSCRRYDQAHARNIMTSNRQAIRSAKTAPGTAHWRAAHLRQAEFTHPIEIQYVNFRGENKTFTGESSSIRVRKSFLTVCVQPTGWRIALHREKIANLAQVEAAGTSAGALKPGPHPTRRESQILNYHKNHGTTSPAYEAVRAKYPNY